MFAHQVKIQTSVSQNLGRPICGYYSTH